MIRRFIMGCAAAAVLGVASPAVADTLVLRSGQSVSGDLVDLGGSGFTFRVSGEERRYRVNEVARIEFSGSIPQDQLNQIKGSQHAVVLTSGQVVMGQLYDVAGHTPKTIVFDTSSGRREWKANEIRAIVLDAAAGSVATSGASPGTAVTAPQGPGLLVPGNERWTDTGIVVRQGQRVSFRASGETLWAPNEKAGPAGSLTGKRTPNAPLPNELAAALIARIGPSETFAIGGPTSEVTMPASGRLFLGINDDGVSDNQGGYRVEINTRSRR